MIRKSVRCNNCFETIESVQCNCGCWTDLRSQQNQSDKTETKNQEIVMNAYESIVSVLKINRQAEQKAIAQRKFETLENIKKEAFEYITSKEFVGVVTSLLTHNYSNTPKLCLTSASLPILNKCVSYEFVDKVVDAFQEAGFSDVVSDYDENEEEYMIVLGFDLSNSA